MPENRLRIEQRLAQQAAATRAQGIERSRQVAAIDRRNRDRANRHQRARVVPVVDMAAKLLQLVVGLQAALGQRHKLGNGQIAEGIRRLPGIEQQSEVGGRDARRLKQALFLDVVRDQVVVALAAKLVEVAPGPQRQLAQESIFFARELRPGLAAADC